MSRTILLNERQDIVEAVLEVLDPKTPDLSDCLVLFPGKRPSHFLRRAIGGRLQTSFLPPRLFSMDRLIEYVYQEELKYEHTELKEIDAVGLLFEWYRDPLEQLQDRAYRFIEEFVPLGLGLFQDLEQLRINKISFKRLSQAVADLPIPETHVLRTIYENFYDRIEAQQWCTRSSRYKTVADNASLIRLESFRKIILAGFFGPTISESDIFCNLALRDDVVFLFQNGPGMDKHLKSLNLKPENGARTEERPNLHFYRAGDTHSQIFGLNAVLEKHVQTGGILDDRMAIILPNAESLFPLVRQTVLSQLEDTKDYNIALGYPVTRTPIYGFFQSLFDLLGSRHHGLWHVPDYVKFILHPYTKNIRLGARSDVTRILFHTIEETLMEDAGRAFVEIEGFESDRNISGRVLRRLRESGLGRLTENGIQAHLKAIHERLLRRFDRVTDLAEMAEACMDVLVYVSEQSTAQLHPMFDRFRDEFLSAIDELKRSRISPYTCRDLKGYWSLVTHHLEGRNVPFPCTPLKGVQVLELLETRSLKFETVFVLDANDDILPGHPSANSLLPSRVRETLGMPTYHDTEQSSRYYFETIVAKAREVHLFFVESGKKERSRFVERLLWEEHQRTGVQPAVRSLNHTIRLHNHTPRPIQKSRELAGHLKTLAYSATALNSYLTCPIQFYYAYGLKLRERDQVDAELDHYQIGGFVHRVLKDYFSPFVGQTLAADRLVVEKMNRIVHELFEQEFGKENTAGRLILRRQIASQLGDFLEAYQKPLAAKEPILIRGVEERISCSRNGYHLVGTIDRVEERAGNVFLIDYKIGAQTSRQKISFKKLNIDDRKSWNKSIGSVQLPFYQLLYSTANAWPARQIAPLFIMLGRHHLDHRVEGFLYDDEASKDQYPVIEDVIFRLLDEITDPGQPFIATERIQEHCPDCAFRYMCGTQWARRWNE